MGKKLRIIFLVIAVISVINQAKSDINEENCFPGVTFFNAKNHSKAAEDEKNFTETVIETVIKYNEWNQVISANDTSDSEKLPHYVVPEISTYEKDFISKLSRNYLQLNAPFDFTKTPGLSTACRMHSHKFLESLRNFELWALKMHDASAKLSSGILKGNINQFGDFDECIGVETPENDFQGKYCLAYLQPTIRTPLKYTNYLKKLIQAHETFKSNFDDPGHRVPRFSTINWAVCVPSSCTYKDVELALKHLTKTYANGTGIELQVRVEDEMCQIKQKDWMENLDKNTKIAIFACLTLLFITFISTLHDYLTDPNDRNQWINSFSLIKNTKTMFNFERDPSDIKSAHAIRFFNAVMLVVSHKCMAMFFNPYTNRLNMTEQLGKPWTVLARAASLYTDPFLMLSGMLTTYSLIGKLQKTGKINVFKEVLGRYLRIMPPLAFLIVFCTFILPLLGSGPQWNLVVTHHSGICRQNWWRNLLFVHNWFGFENMCLTHTHHVGIDTELFWTAPLLILMLWKWPKKGTKIIFGLAIVSTIARYYVTYTHGLSNYIFFGTSVKQLFETADRMYIMPPHRFTVYAMGIGLGYFLRMFKDLKLTKSQLKIGWYLSTVSLLLAFFGPAPMGDIDYQYNPTHAANYAAFAPIAWCIFFSWIIVVLQLGYKNKFTELIEWRGFLFCTKVSYSLYLTQFPIFFFNVGRVRAPIHYSLLSVVIDINEYVCIALASIVLTLLVEMPCNNLKSLLLDRKKSVKIELKNSSEVINVKTKVL